MPRCALTFLIQLQNMYDSDDYGDDWDNDEDWSDEPDDDQDDTINCPNCGAEIFDDTDVCPICMHAIIHDRSPWSGKSVGWIVLGVLGIIATIVMLLSL
ncbi:hypothetical protein GC197_17655 [bacterium]|nr:hypothetical protein [bacterium]